MGQHLLVFSPKAFLTGSSLTSLLTGAGWPVGWMPVSLYDLLPSHSLYSFAFLPWPQKVVYCWFPVHEAYIRSPYTGNVNLTVSPIYLLPSDNTGAKANYRSCDRILLSGPLDSKPVSWAAISIKLKDCGSNSSLPHPQLHWPLAILCHRHLLAFCLYWSWPEQYRSLLSHPSFQCHPNTLTEILLGHVLRCISGSLSLSRFCLNSPWLSPSPVPLILIPDILKQLSFFSYIRIVINLCLYPNWVEWL